MSLAGVCKVIELLNSQKMSVSLRRRCIIAAILAIACQASTGAADVTPEQAAKRSSYAEFARTAASDPGRGEALFNNAQRTACANCHSITGIEKSGPNLDGIADKYPRAELIKHIIDPNLFIQPGYETATILTDSQEIVTGRIRLSTRLEVRLLLASGKLRSIKRSNIEEMKSTNVSMMPEDLINNVSKQEFADLLGYLETLHTSELNAWKGPGEPVVIERLDRFIDVTPIHPPEMKFEDPVWVTEIPGKPGQLLVLEHQQGRIQRLDLNTEPPTKSLFLDLNHEITYSPNQGLMCLAFHPDFERNHKYYVKYEVSQPGGMVLTTINERLASVDHMSDSGTPSRRLLSQDQPAFNHNGGCLAFGPDNLLYIAFGDGGPQKDPPGFSQNARVFHGSILRIDVDARDAGKEYAIPDDNPFLEQHERDPSVKPETWAIGFREPWRFSFDALTGDLWLGDVGQTMYEEVCLVRSGENHGWNVREGFSDFSNQYRRSGAVYSDPVLAYPRSLGVSVTGGYVYRGDPESSFYGAYIFGDYESRKIWGLKQQNGQLTQVFEIGTAPEHIASFGTDQAGNLYLVGYEGTIFKLDFLMTSFRE